MNPSRYLFLQGQISRFFAALGQGLAQRGHAVHRIHFNAGDAQLWALPGAVDFTGDLAAWPDFFNAQVQRWGITDLVLFGDCRPLHREAIRLARQQGVVVHVFEEGYLRPDFITLESGGVNGHSTLPRDAAAYLAAAETLPLWQTPTAIPASFARRAWDDVRYHLGSTLGGWRFPHYRHHKPWHPLREYWVGARRFPLKLLTRARTTQRARAVELGVSPYFLFPLQLDADSQIRFHAPAGGVAGAITQALHSFASTAPSAARLVITEHPLDYGPVDVSGVVARLAQETGMGERVVFLRGGSPMALVKAAHGMVTVNSTIGITALSVGVPVITLGTAIYDLPGLTHQQGLDAFWQAPQRPDPLLFDAFRRVVAARTQVHGGFYSAEGIALAVAGAVQRLAPPARLHSESSQTAVAAPPAPAWQGAQALAPQHPA